MNIAVLELIVVAVVALGLGLWQLYDVNKELRKHKQPDEESDVDRGDERR